MQACVPVRARNKNIKFLQNVMYIQEACGRFVDVNIPARASWGLRKAEASRTGRRRGRERLYPAGRTLSGRGDGPFFLNVF
jgi:hypothetical protein